MRLPTVENSLLVAVDLQQKLLPVISGSEKIVERSSILLQAAAELNMDIVVTEQYPKGLGNTVEELATWLPDKTEVISKTAFSVFGEPAFNTALTKKRRDILIFIGVEMHVCLLQSVLDALNSGYDVWVVADAVGSRKDSDKNLALTVAENAGAVVVSAESLLFMLLRDAKNPGFKAISSLIK